MATIDHPLLGAVRGIEEDGVAKFLGIPYASLEHQFALPKLVQRPIHSGVLDATKHGASVSQHDSIKSEFTYIQNGLPENRFEPSATGGLNLNVFVPHKIEKTSHLPTLVWIHGGGFIQGSITWPQWDLTRLVRLSQENGTPIVAVAMNYRLAVTGFLASKELLDAGIKANRGLRDQAVALDWVRENISGFRGDPNNITIMGQSMGAASCTYHLHSEKPLFKRMVALAGNSLALQPLPAMVAESIYPAVVQSLGLSELASEQRIERLKSIPSDDILNKVPPTLPMLAVSDGEIIPGTLTFASLTSYPQVSNFPAFPHDHWCKEIFTGSCSLDGMILGELALAPRKKGIGLQFADSLRRHFASRPTIANKVLKAYRISEDVPDDEDDYVSICKFASDIVFDATSSAWAEAWSQRGRSYQYYFNEPNPWPGKWHGHATHILDAVFLFQNFNEKLDERQKIIGKKMAFDILDFVYENGIKADFKKAGVPSLVYGDPAKADIDSQTGFRTALASVMKEESVSPDELLDAWNAFFQGR